MAVEKDYAFEGPDGRLSLLDLFEGRRQLIVYRAFYGPEVTAYAEGGSYPERGLCRLLHGGRPGQPPRAPQRARHHPRLRLPRPASRDPGPGRSGTAGRCRGTRSWTTSTPTSASTSGTAHNAFIRDGDRVFRTYFIDGRGDEALGTTWSYLDMTALGRQEEWEDSSGGLPANPAV